MKRKILIQIDDEMYNKMKSYCKERDVANISEFVRNAITKAITPDVSDAALKFESLRDLHNNQKKTNQNLEILFKYLSYFIQYYMLYAEDIPKDMVKAAALNSGIKYDKFFKNFKNILKKTPSFFESLLADEFEEK
jgi:hypothetical protein